MARKLGESLGSRIDAEEQAKKARRTIHSEMHALAKDVSEFCDEPERFARYLGRIKSVGLPVAYHAFSDLKDGVRRRSVKNAARWWMWRTKDLQKKVPMA